MTLLQYSDVQGS